MLPNNDVINDLKSFGRAGNHGKNFPELSQTPLVDSFIRPVPTLAIMVSIKSLKFALNVTFCPLSIPAKMIKTQV